MTVDAHHHLWDIDVRDQPWITGLASEALRRDFRPSDLADAVRGTSVDTTVLVQTVADPDETPEMLVLADSVHCIGAVVGWVDLTARGVRERLGALLSHPAGRWLKGIRHPVEFEADPEWLIRPDVLRGLAAVEDAGLVFELLVRPHQLPAAIKAVGEFPQLTFVLDHCGKPPVGGDPRLWEALVRRLAEHPNVLCKLSGLVTEAGGQQPPDVEVLRPCVEVVLDAFGPGRLMFGSDWPVCTSAASYREVLRLASQLVGGLSQRERTAIFDGTARQVYEL
ncbi:amidohydrolase family protein [Saccharopolyspora sp. NFXS83]|uniref:amidohydrolase family protein n=1 Tax=Saccharopolyspora sp. NFXS83 TaxID=2993560 RepID=UPI00224B1AF8|nr:amidohydrolase family protein [Saccharopolyspora sp. NFXS83]MCX2734395.1 amidohydrolase family protein [Saccharopolyspora sp. NFXS83]